MKINVILKPRIGKKKLHMVQRTDLGTKKKGKNKLESTRKCF
jgi:hypothetical protein